MKRYIFTLLFPVFSCLLVYAQPFNVKKASKAVLTLKTFKADGTLLASSNAFFVGEEGCALSSFAPFRGADRAVVIDAQGKARNGPWKLCSEPTRPTMWLSSAST